MGSLAAQDKRHVLDTFKDEPSKMVHADNVGFAWHFHPRKKYMFLSEMLRTEGCPFEADK